MRLTLAFWLILLERICCKIETNIYAMQKYAEYIRQIEIDSLWSGKKHIRWNLNRQVNVLSGVNGVG